MVALWSGLSLLLAACTAAVPTPATLTPAATGELVRYLTATPTVTPTLPPLPPTPVLPPAPTATPFTHTIAQGETMLGIALRYGVTLEDLQAANPGVDPGFLTIGSTLVIPLGGEIALVQPTATPLALPYTPPICYPTGDQGAWCFILVTNDTQSSLEDLSGWISLVGSGGEVITTQIATTPLNLLRAGLRMPLAAYFSPPLPAGFTARGELLSALDIPPQDARYVDWPVQLDEVKISPDGRRADVQGRLRPPDGADFPSQVWVAGIAYDAQDQVVGMRKWESGEALEFAFTIYSLGPAIAQVEVLVEIRP